MSNWSINQERVFPKRKNTLGNPFYGYRTLNLSLPDGRQATYYGLVPECVHVVALEDDETTYLVRQRRPNVMEVGAKEVPETLELPGGFANPATSLEDSAQTEIKEEIARHAGNLTEVGILFPSVGVSNEKDHIFMGTKLSPVDLEGSTHATEQDMRVISGKFGTMYKQMQCERLPVSAQTLAAMAKVAILL